MKRFIVMVLALCFIFIALSACSEKTNIVPPPIDTPKAPINDKNKNIIGETEIVMYEGLVTEYKIVLPAIPNHGESRASDELVYFFQQASGIKLEVISDTGLIYDSNVKFLSLGETKIFDTSNLSINKDDLGRDGYVIKTLGNSVFMIGGSGNGTLFSVYKFLEVMFGYRYYAKDEIKLDKKTSLNLKDFDIIDIPSIASRNIDAFDLRSDDVYTTRMRMTRSMGNEIEYATSNWSSLNDQSMASQILPYNEYKDREGWFSGDFYNGQMNVTKAYYDEEMFNEFTNNLINNFIAKEPDCKYFMLGMNDNSKNYIMEPHAEDYDKYKASGVMVRFINKVADKVQEWIDENDPEREFYLVMFAYFYNLEAPVNFDAATNQYVPVDESVICNDNVIVRITPIQSHNMYPHLDKTVNPLAEQAFNGWGTVAKNIAVWDYGANFGAYLSPYPDWGTIQENFQMYVDKGVIDIVTQLPAHTAGTSMHDYRIFIRSQLMWNVNADYKELHDEFFNAYYKNAAPSMQKYYDYLVSVYQSKTDIYKGYITYSSIYSPTYWTYDHILQLKALIDEARKSLEPLKLTDKEAYERAMRHVETESLFYRFMEIEKYGEYYSLEVLTDMVNSFEKDAAIGGLIAISNQTYFTSDGRSDRGLLVNVLKDWRGRLMNRQ